MTKKFKIISTILLSLSFVQPSYAGPIDNLERERSRVLSHILNKDISISERKQLIKKSKMRLLDLERMVINDRNISNNPDYNTRKAFDNFELTFLVHTSLEREKSISITWLESIGLTTNNLMSTRVSRK